MKIEDFRPIRSQDSAPIKFDWLLTQESDWIIWTNQKITLIIFWLVKNGKDWNPAIPLVKRIFLVPDHIWPKTIKGQPALTHVIRNYVLLLVVPPLCLWWVTHSDESAQAQNSSRATTTLVSHPPHSNVLYREHKYQSTSDGHKSNLCFLIIANRKTNRGWFGSLFVLPTEWHQTGKQ